MDALSQAFVALADPTRRAILARLALGEASVTELAQPFEMTLPAIVKHIGVLETGGLIRTLKRGRVRTCALEPKGLTLAEQWIEQRRTEWERRLDQLGDYLNTLAPPSELQNPDTSKPGVNPHE